MSFKILNLKSKVLKFLDQKEQNDLNLVLAIYDAHEYALKKLKIM